MLMLFRVTGNNFPSVIYGLSNFVNVIQTVLNNNGISVSSVKAAEATNSFTGYYDLVIGINALEGDDINRVSGLLYQVLSEQLSNLTVNAVTSSTISTGGILPTDNTNPELLNFNDFFNSLKANAPSAPTILGLSATTIALIAIGYLVLTSSKRR